MLQHDHDLVGTFSGLAGNWDRRNELGAEPIRPYLEAIENISSMEEMTSYLLNKDGMNFSLVYPVGIDVGTPLEDRDFNTVFIGTAESFTLKSSDEYSELSLNGHLLKQDSNQKVRYLLNRLGMDPGKTEDIIRKSYSFEIRLSDSMAGTDKQRSVKYLKKADNTFTFDELKEIEGNYPLTDILKHYGLDRSDRYTVCEPDYVKAVGRLYTEQYLPEMKAYFTVHTLNDMLPLLDREAFDKSEMMQTLFTKNSRKEDENPGTDPKSEEEKNRTAEEKETGILLDSFIGKYLAEPMDQIYIARYCSEKEKKDIRAMTEEIISHYRDMLRNETWLSEEARKKSEEKLDNISLRIVYPDTFTDYAGLAIDPDKTLIDAVAAIHEFRASRMSLEVNAPVNRDRWDLAAMPTTIANAFYMAQNNSINIFAGIMADGFFYSDDAPYEQKLGRLGFVIGHEITHGFDTTGYRFDKDGLYNSLWSVMDTQKFQTRSNNLVKFYNAIQPFPGAVGYDGTAVQGEAIADMGGLKCMLSLAAQKPDFDYRLFFTSFAENWRHKTSYDIERRYAEDVHPLAFLRTNVTLQQFDEFNRAYDIGPGDGMYLDPQKRIMVW
jgi:putative endopeptidase